MEAHDAGGILAFGDSHQGQIARVAPDSGAGLRQPPADIGHPSLHLDLDAVFAHLSSLARLLPAASSRASVSSMGRPMTLLSLPSTRVTKRPPRA